MSWFGDNTFKQDLLDNIEILINQHEISRLDAVSEIAAVLAHVADTALSRDDALAKIKAEAREEARKEIISSLARGVSK